MLVLGLPAMSWIRIGLFALAFVALFWRWFWVQHQHAWTGMQDWGHTYAVPLISLYLLWEHRKEVLATSRSTFWPGIAPLVLGIVCYFFFIVGVPNHMLQGWAMVLTLGGAAMLVCGPRMFRNLFLPVLFMLFAIKVSDKIMINVTFPLQLLASQGAFMLLKFISFFTSYTVDVTGNLLEITTASGKIIPLNVAEACSGARMVIGFVVLAAAVAVLGCKHWWQRIALFLLSAPVALLMNVVRVATLGLLSLIDPALAAGQAHMFIGMILLVVALGLFLGILWILQRLTVESAPVAANATADAPRAVSRPTLKHGSTTPGLIAAVALLFGSAIGWNAATRAIGLQLEKLAIYPPGNITLDQIANETPTWIKHGTDHREIAEVEDVLGTRNYVTRVYMRKDANGQPDPSKPVLQFHAAYYTGMIDTVPHVPDRCFVGGGMQLGGFLGNLEMPLDTSDWRANDNVPEHLKGRIKQVRLPNWSKASGVMVTLPRDPQEIRLRTMSFKNNQERPVYAGYFFIANGGTTPLAEGVRLLAFDLTSTYAYYMKVQVTSNGVSSGEELAEQAGSLLSELLPEIMRCVPDWVEVEQGTYPPREAGKAPAGAK